MKSHRAVVVVLLPVVLGMLLVCSTLAQSVSSSDKEYATKGVFELGGDIGYSSYTSVTAGQTSSTTYTSFSLTPSIGYFVTDGLQLALDPFSLSVSSHTGASSSPTEIHIMGGLGYAFKTQGSAYPFIQGLAGYSTYSSGSTSLNGFSWGAKGGVKIVIASHAIFQAGVQYLQITENPSGATSRFGYNELLIGGGFTVWL